MTVLNTVYVEQQKRIVMKNLLKYILTLSMVGIMSVSFAQDERGSNDAVVDAQRELIELKSMDKSQMTKIEKKAWKRKKRALQSFINSELERERMANRGFDPFFYGSPYAYGRFYDPFFNPYRYRRPVVIVRQRPQPQYCPPPSRTPSSNRQARRR